jgi:hypoxanthine phosphoribosyltransferase
MHRIAKQMDGFEFDWYVAIARGGLIPAALLAQITDQRNIDTFCIKRYGKDKKEIAISNVGDKNLSHLNFKNILLIDDILDNGKTMDYVKQYISLYKPQSVKVACLYWKPRSIVTPDFYLSACDNDMWIDFFWEKDQCFVLPKNCVGRGEKHGKETSRE